MRAECYDIQYSKTGELISDKQYNNLRCRMCPRPKIVDLSEPVIRTNPCKIRMLLILKSSPTIRLFHAAEGNWFRKCNEVSIVVIFIALFIF